MNIAIEDIKFLERKYNEQSTQGEVWRLAQLGKSLLEIEKIMGAEIEENKYTWRYIERN